MVSDAAKKKAAAKKALAQKKKTPLKPALKENGNLQVTEENSSATENHIGVQSPTFSETLFSRIIFPSSLTPRQRALLHEFSEENNLQHVSQGDSEEDRKLVIWKENESGEEYVIPEEDGITVDKLAAILDRVLKIDTSALLLKTDDQSEQKRSSATAQIGFGKREIPTVTIEEFVTKMGPLITMEKEAEMASSTESVKILKPETAQRKGYSLLNLRCVAAESGLLGKTLLELRPNRSDLLPPHRFSPHDVVALKGNKADPTAPAMCQGVVYRVRDGSIMIAVDDTPEDGLDSPIRIEKLANDVTYKRFKDTLLELSKGIIRGPATDLVPVLFGTRQPRFSSKPAKFSAKNKGLDHSQLEAVGRALGASDVMLIHGPPGTGKTTTVIEIILQEVSLGHKVLACAASNIAVDNLVERLSAHRVPIVRMGHPARLLPSVLGSALDAQVLKTDNSALANDVRKEMQQLNAKLLKSRDRREKGDIRRELKRLGKEEQQRQRKAVQDVIKDSAVVLTTLTGAMTRQLQGTTFDLVVIDEAAQALEIACWSAILKGSRVILSGDHLQLPPTVQSEKAEKSGLGVTLFERLAHLLGDNALAMLTVQYRMHADIMQWSSREMYNSKLTAHSSVAHHSLLHLHGVAPSGALLSAALVLIDTAGCDMDESKEEEGLSLLNADEGQVALEHARRLIKAGLRPEDVGIITPYRAQVGLLKELRSGDKEVAGVEISTVDGFQGREKELIIISMVRSNATGEVGFLADNRRMNVAVTRARRQCCIVCDSETVSHDPFLGRMVSYFEQHGEILSAMEYCNS